MPQQSCKLILASQSPRRKQLLETAGYRLEVLPPEGLTEGTILPRETPSEYVRRLAEEKAAAVMPLVPEGIVIGCDTVAECRGRILGKPNSMAHAREMLETLRGSVHHVYSGLCLWRRPDDTKLVRCEVTKLRMDAIAPRQIEDYLNTEAWRGKAGAFGYQDQLGWIRIIHGSESNVVGLPMELFERTLAELQAL